MNALRERIAALIEPSLVAMGFGLVRVQIDGKQSLRIQIMAERQDGSGINLEECTAISRAVSALLDVEDPVEGAYSLEVSSPGIDRPLVRLQDFGRYAGHAAKIELKAARAGRRRFTGTLAGVEGETVSIEVDGETLAVPFADIDKARLVLTDKLLQSVKPTIV